MEAPTRYPIRLHQRARRVARRIWKDSIAELADDVLRVRFLEEMPMIQREGWCARAGVRYEPQLWDQVAMMIGEWQSATWEVVPILRRESFRVIPGGLSPEPTPAA